MLKNYWSFLLHGSLAACGSGCENPYLNAQRFSLPCPNWPWIGDTTQFQTGRNFQNGQALVDEWRTKERERGQQGCNYLWGSTTGPAKALLKFRRGYQVYLQQPARDAAVKAKAARIRSTKKLPMPSKRWEMKTNTLCFGDVSTCNHPSCM